MSTNEWHALSPGIHSKTLRVNDLDVHYFEALPPTTHSSHPPSDNTTHPPLLILLHGFPELAYSWRKVMVPLAEAGYRVVAPDQRGYGRTTGRGLKYTEKNKGKGKSKSKSESESNSDDERGVFVMDEDANASDSDPDLDFVLEYGKHNLSPFRMLNLTTDVVSLVYALGHTSCAAIVGHDFGSVVAGWCALIRPDLFKALVLMSAAFTGTPPAFQRPIQVLDSELAKLAPPRKHYTMYYSTSQANADMTHPPQGLHSFLRAYYHVKSADWKRNKPYRLPDDSPASFGLLPNYYVMLLGETMPETVARDAPLPSEVESNEWLTDAELGVYVREYARTGFQGGLNRYRWATGTMDDGSLWPANDLRVYAGKRVEVPAMFLSGEQDWGVYQIPGAVEKMRKETCMRMREEDFVLVPGAGHWVQQEAAGAVVEHLLRFLGKSLTRN